MKVGPQPGTNPPFPATKPDLVVRSGQTLRLFVEQRRGSDVVVRVGSQRFTARFQGTVTVGSWYRVEVLRTGRTLILKTLERAPQQLDLPALLRSTGLAGPHSASVVRAFIETGLPLQFERLELAQRRTAASQRLSAAERARLSALMEDKGLLGSARLFDRILAILGGEAGTDGDDASGSDARRDRDRSGDGREGDGEGDASSRGDGDETSAIAAGVREAFTPSERAPSPVALLNHRVGKGDPWIVVPLEFDAVVGFTATVRMRLPREALEPRVGPIRTFHEALLDIRDGESRWTFAIHPNGRSFDVTVLAHPGEDSDHGDAPGSDADAILKALGIRLGRVGASVHLRPMSKDSNDGFSTTETQAIIRSVDSKA